MRSGVINTRILIIGIGNPLCADDALGCHAVERLRSRLDEAAGIRCETRHQYLPEMSEWLADSDLAIFVDADARARTGEICERELVLVPGPTPSMTHYWTPEALLSCARAWFGHAPRAVLISMGAASFDAAEGVTPAVAAALPDLIARIQAHLPEPVHA